ncbi:MAG: hypothetical protein RBR05_02105 [Candidatus Methanomethylophilaceae archaeon]|nr:hypothetical protein [Candidatus Methanomethylophilaceae archaeon]MDD3378710.1 hypothetical protein [Candidatus Methanomethylophilaceae archaeon]MDY0224178.1 hypothetical protein [Candidatus Methanomethylophilaceae archaeon]
MWKPTFVERKKPETIEDLISTCDQKTLVKWACGCAEHVIFYYERSGTENKAPQYAIQACRDFVKGSITVGDARKFSLASHEAAKTTDDESARAVAHACGHAAATAQLKGNANQTATYALKAVYLAEDDMDAESKWQFKHLDNLMKFQMNPKI